MGAPQQEDESRGGRWIALGVTLVALAIVGLSIWVGKQSPQVPQPAAPASPLLQPAHGWSEVRTVPTGMDAPRGLAVEPDGQRMVCVVGDKCALYMSAKGSTYARRNDFADEPVTVAAGPGGSLVFGFRSHVDLPAKGGSHPVITLGRRAFVTGVALDGKGIWVADAGNRVVSLYDPKGVLVRQVGKEDAANGVPGLLMPSPHLDVLPLGKGAVIVNNPGRQSVETYDVSGRLIGKWGKAGNATGEFAGCCNPTDIARLPDGRIVTSEKGVRRVSVYTAAGTLSGVGVAGEPLSPGGGAFDVATTPDGQILVLDPKARLIRVFSEH